ncbi:tetratricopeptide repeat protein [Ideonella sp. BN130291]|uniref:tetratricopeptide repeat protein n=1 Tax=Ideonella sp. BN130291 TaxID=3112940 RepID=UPI002E26042F|nr:tetratricopeptide repeat protein [Ideonella sp. BN130291]
MAAVSALGASAAAPQPAAHLVQDPHYGDTLFHFYQDHYFSSVTSLMVSQHFGRVGHHADEAEVLRGGLLLSFGLHREAGEIFAQLIDKGAAPPVRDRAWFYLAKIRYQRGLLAEAQEAIGHVENHLPPALEDERRLLQANILLARGDHAGAANVLQAMTASPSAGRYARFNLGVALVRSGDTAGGTRWLDELGRTPAEDEEQRSLRDKANVALGFAALHDNQPEAARGYLERVRLASLQSNKALLGFGWAAAAMKLPKAALVPWTELAKRDPGDASVLEARIAVPYAYAEVGAYGQALQRYQDAIAAFEREAKALDESIAAIRAGKLVDGLLEHNPGEEMGWFWTLKELPQMPHAGHLSQVLAEHEFQEAFKNYRDLRFLASNLQRWAETIGVFSDMLATRRQAFAERLPKVREQASQSGLAAMQQRQQALADEMKAAEARGDGVAFADAKERELMERLARVQAILQQPGDDPELATARERARRVSGALTWQLAQAQPARAWAARKGLETMAQQLEQAQQRDVALAQAQRDEPVRFERFAERIAALDRRVQVLIPRVLALSGEQQRQVQDMAVAQLTRQKERLAEYTMQARFAVAQLYDRAYDRGQQVKEGGNAAR